MAAAPVSWGGTAQAWNTVIAPAGLETWPEVVLQR